MTTTMRERFDEEFYSNPDTNGDLVIQWKIGDAENTKNTLMDFIEQEIKKEREDIVDELTTIRHGYETDRRVNTGSYGKTVAGVQRDTVDQIINTIKNSR